MTPWPAYYDDNGILTPAVNESSFTEAVRLAQSDGALWDQVTELFENMVMTVVLGSQDTQTLSDVIDGWNKFKAHIQKKSNLATKLKRSFKMAGIKTQYIPYLALKPFWLYMINEGLRTQLARDSYAFLIGQMPAFMLKKMTKDTDPKSDMIQFYNSFVNIFGLGVPGNPYGDEHPESLFKTQVTYQGTTYKATNADLVLQQNHRCQKTGVTGDIDGQCCGVQLGPGFEHDCEKGGSKPSGSCADICMEYGRIGDDNMWYGCGNTDDLTQAPEGRLLESGINLVIISHIYNTFQTQIRTVLATASKKVPVKYVQQAIDTKGVLTVAQQRKVANSIFNGAVAATSSESSQSGTQIAQNEGSTGWDDGTVIAVGAGIGILSDLAGITGIAGIAGGIPVVGWIFDVGLGLGALVGWVVWYVNRPEHMGFCVCSARCDAIMSSNIPFEVAQTGYCAAPALGPYRRLQEQTMPLTTPTSPPPPPPPGAVATCTIYAAEPQPPSPPFPPYMAPLPPPSAPPPASPPPPLPPCSPPSPPSPPSAPPPPNPPPGLPPWDLPWQTLAYYNMNNAIKAPLGYDLGIPPALDLAQYGEFAWQPFNVKFVNANDMPWIVAIYAAKDEMSVKQDTEGRIYADPQGSRVLYDVSTVGRTVSEHDDRIGPGFNATYLVVRMRFNRAEMAERLAQTFNTMLMKVGLHINVSYTLGSSIDDGGYQRAAYDCAISRAMRREPEVVDEDAPWKPSNSEEFGINCIGHANRTTGFEHYCGHWDVTQNDEAMPGGAFNQSQPYCLTMQNPSQPKVLTKQLCPHTLRNTRAGYYELNHWKYNKYCDKFNIFRLLHGGNSIDNVTDCENHVANLTFQCFNTECPQCNTQCTIPALKRLGGALRCFYPQHMTSQLYCGRNTDLGLFVSPYGIEDTNCVGPRCKNNAPRVLADGASVPAIIFQEHYRTCVQNPEGYIARAAVTCRSNVKVANATMMSQRIGRYHTIAELQDDPPLHMIPCEHDSDCEVACPRHGRTGRYYRCMRPYHLYDHMITYNDSRPPAFINRTTPLGAVKNAPFDPSRTLTRDGLPLDGIWCAVMLSNSIKWPASVTEDMLVP